MKSKVDRYLMNMKTPSESQTKANALAQQEQLGAEKFTTICKILLRDFNKYTNIQIAVLLGLAGYTLNGNIGESKEQYINCIVVYLGGKATEFKKLEFIETLLNEFAEEINEKPIVVEETKPIPQQTISVKEAVVHLPAVPYTCSTIPSPVPIPSNLPKLVSHYCQHEKTSTNGRVYGVCGRTCGKLSNGPGKEGFVWICKIHGTQSSTK